MSSWEYDTLANIADVRVSNVDKKSHSGEISVRLCNYMDVYSRDYITQDIDFMEATAAAAEIERFGIARGDVMLTKDSETPEDIGIVAAVVDDIPKLVCGYHLALLRPKADRVNSVYLAKQLATTGTARRFARLASGSTRYGLSYGAISGTPIRLPSLPVQRRIAEILSTVDEAIERTEKLIAKHQQIKAGLMHDLFTRGLTPDGHLRPPHTEALELYKDSPLGPIPKEWEVVRLAELLRDKPRNGYSPSEAPEWEGIYSLGLGCLTPDGFQPRQLKFVPSDSLSMKDVLLHDGDLLLSRSNTRSLVGLCGRYRDVGSPCIYPDLMMRLRSNDRMPSELLEAILLSPFMRRQIASLAVGTSGSMVKLNASSVLGLAVAAPADSEHGRMLEITRAIQCTLNRLGSEYEKDCRFKRGLMHDLLTGEVEVALANDPGVTA